MKELIKEAQQLIIDWAQEKIEDTENDLSFGKEDMEYIEWGELTILIDEAYITRMKVYNPRTSAFGIIGTTEYTTVDCKYHVEDEDGKTVIEEQQFTKRITF